MCSNMSSPETQIHSQCSLTFILFIHSWKNKHSGRGGRWRRRGGLAGEGVGLRGSQYKSERQLVLSLPSAALQTHMMSASRLIGRAKQRLFTFTCKVRQLRCVCAVCESGHLSGHRWTHLCSFASAVGSTYAERRYTATPGRLEHAGQRGTYTCKERQKHI